jgi:diguanylate cyclase (GGDEF)-like protein
MFTPTLGGPIALDITTLSVVAVLITVLLGACLLFVWRQDRVPALAWWGAAYLIGGLSVAIWSIEDLISPPLPPGLANSFLFLACGMIWSAARLFHGRPVRWAAMSAGAALWLLAGFIPDFVAWGAGRLALSSIVIASYTFLTAAELWRERRKTLLRRWPAIFVPILHGAIFLFPIPLASRLPEDRGVMTLASGWVALLALEMIIYAVSTAFIVLVLAKERVVRGHKDAASTDPLTGLFNRRGFFEATAVLLARRAAERLPITVLVFDLDHFKSINDRFGHLRGDDILQAFAATIGENLRAHDIAGRLGGEEFAAVLPCTLAEGLSAAERVRAAFAVAGAEVAGLRVGATVSIGAACADPPSGDVERLIGEADRALYRAKANGRNQVTVAEPGEAIAA